MFVYDTNMIVYDTNMFVSDKTWLRKTWFRRALRVFVRILFVSEMLGSYSTKNTLKYVHLHCVRILFVCTYLYVLLVYASICM